MPSPSSPEPWLRGTLIDIDPVRRAVLHALQLASEDASRWCLPLTDDQITARPHGLPSVAFHLRHIARSLDRLLTYAEGEQLSAEQLQSLTSEMDPGSATDVQAEFNHALATTSERIRRLPLAKFDETRSVGRSKLPTTVAGLVIHCADHTQRHIGQAVTTAKIVTAPPSTASPPAPIR